MMVDMMASFDSPSCVSSVGLISSQFESGFADVTFTRFGINRTTVRPPGLQLHPQTHSYFEAWGNAKRRGMPKFPSSSSLVYGLSPLSSRFMAGRKGSEDGEHAATEEVGERTAWNCGCKSGADTEVRIKDLESNHR